MLRAAALSLVFPVLFLSACSGEEKQNSRQPQQSSNSQTSQQLLDLYRDGQEPSQAEVVALARRQNPRASVRLLRKDVVAVCESPASGNCILTLTPTGPIAVTAGSSYREVEKTFDEQILLLKKAKKEQGVINAGPQR